MNKSLSIKLDGKYSGLERVTDWLYLETMNAWLEYPIQNDNGIEQQLGLAYAIPG